MYMTTAKEVLQQQVPPGEAMGGTDGFRAPYTDLAGPGLMNPETVAGLTCATIAYQQETNGIDGPVVVAQDTRPHGERLRHAVIAAALAQGSEVIDLGVAPTPAAQKIASKAGAMATFVLTASHNPAPDNGLKYMVGWQKPSKDQVRTISDQYWTQQDTGLLMSQAPGRELAVRDDLRGAYETAVVDDIREAFGTEKPLAGKRFVVDGANGAALRVTPSIFR
jgi:phosphomannomutase